MSVGERPFAEIDDATRKGVDPPNDHRDYVGTRLRAPKQPLVILPGTETELTGPAYGESAVEAHDADLTRQHAGEPLGQRILLEGRVLGSDGKPLRGQLIEIWQANAAGRYRHAVDTHDAPLDPNFSGAGRCLTDDEGRYRFVTIKPGIYPWEPSNAWRPAHIHFSLFGRAFTGGCHADVFPDDPLFPFGRSTTRSATGGPEPPRECPTRLTEPDWALGFRWDIVLGGREATPIEEPHDD
jgi:protocatechuate 3,4-dioxygenase beta subunit